MFKEKNELAAFRFSATSQEVRSLLIEKEPWFVAKDLCDILGLPNTSMALSKLDADEKLTSKILMSGQSRNIWMVNESGLYALILRSNKPEARAFRKWITKDVLPALRKTGFYGQKPLESNYLDLRDVPYIINEFNGTHIRVIQVNDEHWFSLNDIYKSINSSTQSNQGVKQLNRKQRLAQKIWIFGNTHPAWFVNILGFRLIISSSKKIAENNPQKCLTLNLTGHE